MSFVTKHYISDTHFSHTRILELSKRPFRDIREHDETLIRNWNSVVKPDDLVFHLGDFAFELGDVERIRGIFFRLNGRKRLIVGNHDLDKKGRLHTTLAGLPWDAPPTPGCETTDEGVRIYMHHYACRVWPASHHGSVHFYGHSHGSLPGVGLSRDVGVDCPDVAFTPRTFRELTKDRKVWKSVEQARRSTDD